MVQYRQVETSSWAEGVTNLKDRSVAIYARKLSTDVFIGW